MYASCKITQHSTNMYKLEGVETTLTKMEHPPLKERCKIEDWSDDGLVCGVKSRERNATWPKKAEKVAMQQEMTLGSECIIHPRSCRTISDSLLSEAKERTLLSPEREKLTVQMDWTSLKFRLK